MARTKWRVAVTLEEYEVSDDPVCDDGFECRTVEDEEVGEFDDKKEARVAWAKAVKAAGEV